MIRREIEQLADDITGARVDALHGARRLYKLWREHLTLQGIDLDSALHDDVYVFLMGIDSETDGVPFGAERALWAPDALAEVEARIGAYRREMAPRIIDACRTIRARVAADPDGLEVMGAAGTVECGMTVEGFPRITFEPGKMGGKACIRGMRFPVSVVLRMVAGGMSIEEILAEHPDLEAEDIAECLRYAAFLADDRVVPLWPTGT